MIVIEKGKLLLESRGGCVIIKHNEHELVNADSHHT